MDTTQVKVERESLCSSGGWKGFSLSLTHEDQEARWQMWSSAATVRLRFIRLAAGVNAASTYLKNKVTSTHPDSLCIELAGLCCLCGPYLADRVTPGQQLRALGWSRR